MNSEVKSLDKVPGKPGDDPRRDEAFFARWGS